MTSFIFVRHGKSQANLDGEIATEDSPLTKEGAAQARKTGRELKSRGITKILASPYPRARETAEIIAKQLKIKDIEFVDDLRERGLGNYKGRKKEEKTVFYFTVDNQNDVEPRGVLIARCEAALAKIKKLAETETVLVVGHAVSGWFLEQVADGHRLLEEFDEPKEPANAKPVTVAIRDLKRPSISKDAALTIAAIVLGLAALITGIVLLMNQRAPQETGVKQKEIPLHPEDYKDDPNLQGAIQKLQDQQGSATQSDPTAASQLQQTQPLQQNLGQ